MVEISLIELLVLLVCAYGFGVGTPILIEWKKDHEWIELIEVTWKHWFNG